MRIFTLGNVRDESTALNGIAGNPENQNDPTQDNPVYGEHVGSGDATFAQSIRAYDAYSRSVLGSGSLLADFYASLVESEGNHYATYLIMARHIDEAEADRRLDFFLDLDAQLIRQPNPLPMLH